VERVSSEGEIGLALDREQAASVMAVLKRQRFEAVAVCFLWSIVNPANELAMSELIEAHLPGVPYTLSHKLLPVVREYRRASATAMDASLKPLMQRHLVDVEEMLRGLGFGGRLVVSTSAGGCLYLRDAVDRPIRLIKSGPAMAPLAGKVYAEAEALGTDAIVCDTGGTTFDVGLVRGGRLVFNRESWLPDRWTGHMIGMSTVDVRSIGAGGGSIAWIDAGGMLRLGPHSAGSAPGPASYGAGGDQPTVTDAAVVLGYINPDYFLGGRMRLDAGAAAHAIGRLARQLRRGRDETAFAILALANEQMVGAIRQITVNEGVDPRESALIAGGGAAGLNIAPIARELGCGKILVPRTAAALSAAGMHFADVVFEQDTSCITRSDDFDYESVAAALGRIERGLAGFRDAMQGFGDAAFRFEYFVEARYLFQVWELDVPLASAKLRSASDLDALAETFHGVHERVFAVKDPASPIEFVNWKGRLGMSLEGLRLDAQVPRTKREVLPAERRQIYFGDGNRWETPVYRDVPFAFPVTIEGPAIIEESDTTIVVYPGMSAVTTKLGNFLLVVG
jgi:N-methylhydantoinase A